MRPGPGFLPAPLRGSARVLTLALALVAVLAASVSAPAAAQMDSREGIALQNQILELRRDLQAVQAQRGGGYVPPPAPRGGGGGGDIAPQLLDRIQTLEDQVRRIQGQLDEQANASRRALDELAKQVSDLNFKLQNGGGGAASAQPSGPAPSLLPPTPGTPAGSPARRPPELAMQEGNAALARRDYLAAEAAAREVLAARGTRSGDAQFLLAQALAGKRDWQGSAIAYDDAYNRSRNGARAPDALLGLANAMLALNDRTAACASVDKLRAEFPSPRSDIREGAAAIRGRAGCR